MNDSNTIVAIALLGFLAAVVLVPVWLHHRTRAASLRIIAAAIEKGQTPDPALVDRLISRPAAETDKWHALLVKWYALLCLFFGVASLSVGLALALGGQLFGGHVGQDGSARAGMMVGALVNGCVGVGFAGLGIASLRIFVFRKGAAPNRDFTVWLALLCLFCGVASLSVGIGLALGSQFYTGPVDPDGSIRAGILVGALITGFSGFGLTTLGVVVLRLFGGNQEA